MGGAAKGSEAYQTSLQRLENNLGIVIDDADSLTLAQAIVSGQMDAASESATYLANELFTLDGAKFDASNWKARLAELMASEDAAVKHTATLVNSLLNLDGTTVSAGPDGKIRVRLGGGGGYNTKAGSSGSKSGGGGGSSSKQKSEIEQMIDLMDQIQSFYAHRNKLIKSTQNYYQTSGELTNLIHAYEQEREELEANNKVLEDNLAKITPLLEAKEKEAAAMDTSASEYEQVEKDLKALQKAHMQYTEELADNKTAVLELNKAIKEQRDAIRDMEIELRETILKAIEDREELNERMLQGTIDVENEILNIIKKRYEDERDAIKKTTEAKKDALEAEKDLLDKQLSDRKKLADQEEKQLKLTQLEAKLARIAADPTRSKEALDLRKQIAELRKDMAWDLAEDEVDAQKESIDQQIDSLEDYIEYVEDYYEELFKHPQKLIQEMREIIVKSDTEIMEWLKHNSEEYAASTEATQQSMTKGWQDMLDDMHGSIKTYWDEVEQIIAGGDDAIINFLKENSADYKAAGKLQAEAYVDEWKKQIEDLKKAYKDAYEYANSFDYSSIKTYTGSTGGGTNGGGTGLVNGYKVTTVNTKSGNATAVKEFSVAQYGDAALANAQTYATNMKKIAGMNVTGPTKYAQGGIADFTGPAWLDGSPSAPERILSPLQTQLFEDMVASLQQIKVKVPNFFTPDGIQTGTAGQNFAFGDINISVDSLDNDADLNDLAERIKEHIMDSLARGSVVGGIRMTR